MALSESHLEHYTITEKGPRKSFTRAFFINVPRGTLGSKTRKSPEHFGPFFTSYYTVFSAMFHVEHAIIHVFYHLCAGQKTLQ